MRKRRRFYLDLGIEKRDVILMWMKAVDKDESNFQKQWGRTILAVMLLFAFIVILSRNVYASPTVTYLIHVYDYGNASVSILISDTEAGSAFTFTPKFENYTVETVSGTFQVINQTAVTYFYDNYTISYQPGEDGVFRLNISFMFPYASLSTGSRAWFMTPLLGAPKNARVFVNVTLDNFGKLLRSDPHPINQQNNKLSFIVLDAYVGSRVAIEYQLAQPLEEKNFTFNIDGTEVTIKAPTIYTGLAKKIANIYGKTKNLLDYVFVESFDKLEFQLFLPRLRDVSTLGYVRGEEINVGGSGPIWINIALLRYVPGYFETTVVHEYVHKALARAGIEANSQLRWFHEGTAQYVALEVCKQAGINVSFLEKERERAFKYVEENIRDFGFLQNWNTIPDQGLAYAASEYIVTKLAEKYGGLSFIRRVVQEAMRTGSIKTNSKLVQILSSAAGENLAPQFRDWGFTIELEDENLPLPHLKLISILIIAGVAVFSVYILIRYVVMRGKKPMGDFYMQCPHCGAIISKDIYFCPYCGREVKELEIELHPSDWEALEPD